MDKELLETTLARLHTEPLQSVMDREANSFDRLAGPFSRRLILFGAGDLGRVTARGLKESGNPPLFFADNNPRLWGSSVEGVKVLPPVEAIEKYGASACFVVTVYNGSAVRAHLRQLGCEYVVHFAALFWKYSRVFIPSSCLGLPSLIFDSTDAIRHGYSVLADDHSRKLFCEQLTWRVLLNSEAMSPHCAPSDMYFQPDLITPSAYETFVDCGAFDGDSIRSFLHHNQNRFERIYALEPDPINRETLNMYLQMLPDNIRERITVFPYALGDSRTRVLFSAGHSVASKIISESDSGETECLTLDELMAGQSPTFIKMDIEGAEPGAIEGAARVLNESLPVLAACVYHRSEHLWEIPSLTRRVSTHHEIFLRRYAEDCWELACYAIPEHRLAANNYCRLRDESAYH
jgi:FkbM family methyltransferase